jgi:RNA polymerase sigma-70 factor (sigma-E family)
VKLEQEKAFNAFVSARSRHLLQTAFLLTGDRHRAEDLLQTALTRAYLRWDRIESEDPEGYVRRTLANAHIDWWRRKPWREEPAAELPDVAGPDQAEAYDVRNAVLGALAGLSRRQRAVVVLRYYEDLSEAEIAAVLGCSPGTVKSAASRAMSKLRAHPGLAAQREEVA